MPFSITVSDAAATLGVNDQSAKFLDNLDTKLGTWTSTTQAWDSPTSSGQAGVVTLHYSSGLAIQLTVFLASSASDATISRLDLQSADGTSLVTYSGSITANADNFGSVLRDDLAFAGSDTITGGSGNDTLEGYAGNDSIDGGGGTDTAVFRGLHDSYTVASTSGTLSVTGADGTDTLTNVERLQFDDGVIAFDLQGNAGQAFRLYQAAFGRTPDLAGLGYQVNDLDKYLNIFQVAGNFIASPEFQSKYGSVDNVAFLTLLYQNVLHREPDSGGLQFHLAEFASGQSRAEMLVHFSESPENQANVIGLISNGIFYVPYGG